MADTADIVIAGGGPVGAALALALADGGLDMVVLEAREPAHAAADPRPLALSYGSRLILERLGVWGSLGSATPILQIHVSQLGGFGRVSMTAEEARLPALGYVVDYGRLHTALRGEVERRMPGVLRQANVSAIRPDQDWAEFEYEADKMNSVKARLAVVADGGAPERLAQRKVSDYGQSAVVAVVKSEKPHGHIAYERFTAEGPVALLPSGADHALVWSMSSDLARSYATEDAAPFLQHLQRAFGMRLGRFSEVGARSSFPLVLKHGGIAGPRTLYIGNASQTLHPVAGQGFNLGLRDAWELAEITRCAAPGTLGCADMIAAYRKRRRIDRAGAINFTDRLVRLFPNDLPPFRVARGLGLALLDTVTPAKDFLIRRMIFGTRG
jgi:2-octaprenyl-6-methoxyphenol hydroxylase